MGKSLINVKSVGKSYTLELQKKVHALKEVSLDILAGEFICLIGPSGCGKSTLLRILAGIDTPTQGAVQFTDHPQTAMVFQNFALFPWLTVKENVSFGLKMRGDKPQKIEQIVQAHIQEMGLHGFEDKHPKELSGGM